MSELSNNDVSIKKDSAEEGPSHFHNDDGTIEALGYGSSYKRVLRTLGNVCWAIGLTAPVSAEFIMAVYQISYGGYFGMIWGWVLPSFIMMPQVLAFSELCSSMPVNGAGYWWTAALAPPKWSRPLSFVSGCTTIVCLFTQVASYAYASSSIVTICAVIFKPDFHLTEAQQMGIAMAMVLFWIACLTIQLHKVAWIMIVCTIIPLAQTMTYLIGLPITHKTAGMPFSKGSDVFGTYTNFSDWGAAVAVPITWFSAVWANAAWPAPAYIVEGTKNSRLTTPKSMVMSYIICAVIGAVTCLVAAFCIPDMEAAAMDPTGYPLVTNLVEHWGKEASIVFMLSGAIGAIIGGSGWLLSFSFQLSAFSRDGGLPMADYLTYVHPRTNTPVYAAATLSIGSLLILLLALSATASSIIYSLSVIVNSLMIALPIGLRIFAGKRWVPGPFNLGVFSKPVHTWAFLAQLYMVIMFSFPMMRAWTAETFNYNWVLGVATILTSIVLYFIFGSRYKGINLEALEAYRQGQT